jgi:hypothetical protein
MIEDHEVGLIHQLVMFELIACPILKVLQQNGDVKYGDYKKKWTS